jgi:hypothetical protein
MYGTVARLRVKVDAGEAFQRLNEEYAGMGIPGLVGEVIYRADGDGREYWLAVVFESKESYRRNAESAEQHARYERLRALLEADPEWHDGEVVSQFPPR